jgi:Sulfotransferase domain
MAKRSLTRGVYGGVRLLQRASSPARMLPTFLIVGAKRAGTSSLYQYLIRHPDVHACISGKGAHYFDVCYQRGWRWYRSSFPLAARGGITGEASPYYMFHPLAPARIAAALPAARLIVVLRNPVDRAWSHYHNERRLGVEPLRFEDAIGCEPERLAGQAEQMAADPGFHSFAWRHHSYLARGRYAEQLDRLYHLFPPDQVLVIQSELLHADPNRALESVWRFLGLAPFTVHDRLAYKANDTHETMAAATREGLNAYFEEPNRRLYRLPGVGFRWSVAAPPPDLPTAKE